MNEDSHQLRVDLVVLMEQHGLPNVLKMLTDLSFTFGFIKIGKKLAKIVEWMEPEK